jgi:TonB-linked SusC/RagA family outer membrane protein
MKRNLSSIFKSSAVYLKQSMILLLAIFVFTVSNAQKRTITGVVTDSNGVKLPGVSISIKGNQTASTITDLKGVYSINISGDRKKLVFASIGFLTKEVVITNQTTLNISLVQGTSSLEEVVVIGYGTQKKRDVSGAISTVGSKQIAERQAVDIFDALQGQAPGIQIAQESGRPGAESSVRIRGVGTFEGGADPLYIVDGVQGVSMDGINPNDIESIEILRDAASAAIYGSRSANGVIIVTTKKGKEGKVKVDVHTLSSYGRLAHKLPQATAAERRLLDYKRTLVSNSTLSSSVDSLNPSANADNDYQDMLTRTGAKQQVDVSLSGGLKTFNYFGSVGLLKDNGIILNSWSNVVRARFNTDYKPSDKLTFSTKVNGSYRTENRINDGDVLSGALARQAYLRVYLPDGSFLSRVAGSQPNPLAQVLTEKNDFNTYNIGIANTGVFTIARDLKFTVDANITAENKYNSDFLPNVLSSASPAINSLTINNTFKTYWQFQGYLNYNRNFGRNHSINGVLGVSTDQTYTKTTAQSGTSLISETVITMNSATQQLPVVESPSRDFSNSVFARVGYTYLSRYIINSTVRVDQSSRFPDGHRTGAFPSVSVAWRYSEEGFFDWAKKYLDDGKLRISYGLTGNDRIGAYDQFTRYGTGKDFYNGVSGVALNRTLGNNNLTWERNKQFNIGSDANFLKGRLTISMDYYDKINKRLLYTAPLPSSTGFNSVKNNIGSVQNKGFEYIISGYPIRKKDISWNISFNMSYNYNKVLELYKSTDLLPGNPNIWKVSEGGHIGNFYGYKALGVYAYDESNAYNQDWQLLTPVFNNNVFTGYTDGGKPYNGQVQKLYVNGVALKGGDMMWQNTVKDSLLDDKDRVILGNAMPKWTAGLTNLVNYKQFTLSFSIYISWGGTIYNDLRQSLNASITTNNTPEPDFIKGSWVKQGDVTIYPSPAINTGKENGRDGSSLYFEDASFIRFRNIKLAYQIPKKTLTRLKLNGLSFFVFGNNLLTWTKYKGYDPEISFANVLTPGIDSGRYPRKKELGFGLNLTF